MEAEQDDFGPDYGHDNDDDLKKKCVSIESIRLFTKVETLDNFMLSSFSSSSSSSSVSSCPSRLLNNSQTICNLNKGNVVITNIVVQSNLDYGNIDLRYLAWSLNNCEYTPQNSANPLVIQMRCNSDADGNLLTCNVSRKGCLRIFNCRSMAIVPFALRRFARKIQRVIKPDDKKKIKKPHIVSIAANLDFRIKIRSMEVFANKHEHYSNDYFIIYDPEISPALQIKRKGIVTLKLTSEGHVSFFGAKKISDIVDCILLWYPRFEEYSVATMVDTQQQLPLMPTHPMDEVLFEKEVETKLANKNIKIGAHFPAGLAALFAR